MTGKKTNNLSDAIRNLIVCNTQFGWNGATTLKLPELLDLQARGWLIEGDENNEFSLTVEGETVIARALRQALPAELAEQQGVDMADADTVALEIARRFIPVDSPGAHNEGQQRAALQVAIVGAINATLAATGKQQVGEVQGDALTMIGSNLRSILDLASKMGGGAYQLTVSHIQHETNHALHLLEAALAARQPGAQDWRHIANEWADATANGVQWLRNIRDGVCTAADALAIMESNVERIQQMKPPAQVIDLGQCTVVEWQKNTVGGWHAISQSRYDDYARRKKMGERVPETRALIDSKRDAAPGVGNG